MTREKSATLLPIKHITRSILILRGHKVLLDLDLAALYGVTTARLNQQVRRNLGRFPDDFMFQLTLKENTALILQFATSKPDKEIARRFDQLEAHLWPIVEWHRCRRYSTVDLS